MNMPQILFLTLVRAPGEWPRARLLIDSLRAFGGDLGQSPVWVFDAIPYDATGEGLANVNVQVLPLRTPETVQGYLFADKVYACARAEELASAQVQSLIWIDPACLIVRPPQLYDLGGEFDAAVRPVHIRNVGLPPEEPLDAFWKKICETAGLDDIRTTVETFVDGKRIRAYFNSHAFAMNPAKGLLRRWFECFEALVRDEEYQRTACQDDRQRVFLHQAVWSALIAAGLAPQRVRILPPDYNYPYNLHASVPAGRRARALNDLVSFTYEDRSLDPGQADDIEVQEPLRAWLSSHMEPMR